MKEERERMIQAFPFDFVHDAQRVYRKLLQAMANPGRICSIETQALKFEAQGGALAAIGCTLLDNEVSAYVEKNPRLLRLFRDLTLTHPAELSQADYLFFTSPMNYASVDFVLKNAKRGTLADPQASATLIFFCENLCGTTSIALTGPGVDGARNLRTVRYVRNIIVMRQNMRTEYPCGLDLIFADRGGRIMAIPRLVSVPDTPEKEEDEIWHTLR